MNKVLLCAAPDLNLIDGSSIWAQTIALVLAESGKARLDYLAKSKPDRQELYAPLLTHTDVRVVDGTDPAYWGGKKFRRLQPAQMIQLAAQLDITNSYDHVVIRGFDLAKLLLDKPDMLRRSWIYLTDIPQQIEKISPEDIDSLRRLAQSCEKILYQAEGFRRLWLEIEPALDASKLALYSPVIPNMPITTLPVAQRRRIAVYAGKFKADWKTLEMAEVWAEAAQLVPGAKLIMIGDKIHDEVSIPGYKEQMRQRLMETDGLEWLGAKSREDVQEQLESARVGLSWRAESMNDSLELSTKVLEYGRAGCAAILNRTMLHEQLLGEDYPLFANSREEFREKLVLALSDDTTAQTAAKALRDLASKHTFSRRVVEVQEWLSAKKNDASATAVRSSKKIRVLVAGHDLKFFYGLQKRLEETGRFEFSIDQWGGHNKFDEARSLQLLEKADVIFCEWCLGNVKWYSHNKRPQQRLVARFHAQEKDLPYLSEADEAAIDHVSYVSDHIRRAGFAKVAFPDAKTSIISNLLDDRKFKPLKKMGDSQYTLGIIGVTPRGKRLDRALDLLELLAAKDNRYVLRIKGRNPLDYPWIVNRKAEVAYYEDIYRRINASPLLRYRVMFDPAGDDVNEWLSLVGYILSPSDQESFHMSIGEGMLTGAVPIIWNWEGADQIWPREFVISSVEEAAELVLRTTPAQWAEQGAMVRNYVVHKYGANAVVDRWKQIIVDGRA